MLEFVLFFMATFGAFVAFVGFNDAYELWRVDRTNAVFTGAAAFGMTAISAFITYVFMVLMSN
jgi:hypothetical protein